MLAKTSTNKATCDTMIFQNVKSVVFTMLSHIRMSVSRSINADRKENDDMKMDRAASFDCLASNVIYYIMFQCSNGFLEENKVKKLYDPTRSIHRNETVV